MSLRTAIGEDIRRYQTQSADHRAAGDTVRTRISALLSPSVQCLILHRLSHWFWAAGWRRAARWLTYLNAYVLKAYITPDSEIGPGAFFPHPAGITFCGRAGPGLTVFSFAICCPQPSATWSADRGPRLGDHVRLGAHAVLVGSVRIGSHTQLGPASVVLADLPENSLVFSRILRWRPAEKTQTP
jgi:serine O-acetyltransferase